MTRTNLRRSLLGGSVLATALVIGAVTAGFLGMGHAARSAAPAAMPPTPVSVAAVEHRDLINWSEFSGRLEAIQRVEIRSRVSGLIDAVHFSEGSLVKQGDLLITIDRDRYVAEYERAQAQVLRAQARVTLTTDEHQRGERLITTQAVSQRDLDVRVNAKLEAVASLRSAEAELKVAKLNLDYTEIRAPISGRIGKLEVTAGNLVAAGAGAPLLATLVSVTPIYATFNADEKSVLAALASLPAGQARSLDRIPVRIKGDATDAEPIEGKLRFVDNTVDPLTGTVRLRAILDNNNGDLIPGQFVRAQLGQARSEQTLVINERAVGTDQDKKFVFIVGTDRKVAYREITLGAAVDGLRIVKSGLNAGENVVVNGLQRVRPGVVVEPENVPMTSKSELRNHAAAAGGKLANR